MYFAYILLNPECRIYIGCTEDLNKRLDQHNNPDNDMSKYTKRYSGPWRLIHAESFPTRSDAMKREKELKSGKGREWIKAHLLPLVVEEGGC